MLSGLTGWVWWLRAKQDSHKAVLKEHQRQITAQSDAMERERGRQDRQHEAVTDKLTAISSDISYIRGALRDLLNGKSKG